MLISSPATLALFATDQRKKLKLSQAEVGNRVGLRQQTISDFENKSRWHTIRYLIPYTLRN